MKKFCSIMLMFLLILVLTGCDANELETQLLDAETRVTTLENENDILETKITALETLVDSYIISNNNEITGLEEDITAVDESMDLIEIRVVDMETLYVNYDDQWLRDFVEAYDEYDDQWLVQFVAAYDEYDDQWMIDFVAAFNEYGDSTFVSLIYDLRINYHYETVVPEYIEPPSCPTQGVEDTETDFNGSTLYCYYSPNGISLEKFHVYYDTGELKYELAIGWDTLENMIVQKTVTYLFRSGDLYFIGANYYDNTLGQFTGGMFRYYELNGDGTSYSPFLENDLWEVFIEYYLD